MKKLLGLMVAVFAFASVFSAVKAKASSERTSPYTTSATCTYIEDDGWVYSFDADRPLENKKFIARVTKLDHTFVLLVTDKRTHAWDEYSFFANFRLTMPNTKYTFWCSIHKP